MNKLFVLACLCACAFADWLSNKELSCPFHIEVEPVKGPGPEPIIRRMTEGSSSSSSAHFYGVFNYDHDYPLYAKIGVEDNSFYYILRCDEHNDEHQCYMQYYDSEETEPCVEQYVDPDDFPLPPLPTGFSYNEEKYPVDTNCTDGSSGCKLYCDYDDDYCIVVNAEGYIVMADGFIFTYHEAPSMDVFEVDKCNASDPHAHLDAPVNSCGKMEYHLQPSPDCMYHFSYVDDGGHLNPLIRDDESTEYYVASIGGGIMMSSDVVYAKIVIPSTGETTLYRCDMKNEDGYCYFKREDGSCDDGYESPYIPSLPEGYVYDSANYPKPVDCPDNSTGCKLYCQDVLENVCVIVDPAGNIVKDYDDSIYAYFETPSIDEFGGNDCDSEPLPTPYDFCADIGTLSPVYPECSFHIRSVGGQMVRRDSTFKLPRSDDAVVDLYFLRVNDDLLAVKMELDAPGEHMWVLYRLDVTDSAGNCYARADYDGECEEPFFPEVYKFMLEYEALPHPIQYNMSEYPVDVQCPDETDGCKLYCDIFGRECVAVDSNGYFVWTQMYGNMTYDSDFTFDVFETVRCDNVTLVPAPSSDVCLPPSSSTTVSSSTPSTSTSSTTPSTSASSTKPQSSTINPSLSSASVTKAIFSVVAIAIAVALL